MPAHLRSSQTLPDWRSVSLEDRRMRDFAQCDPRQSLQQFPAPLVSDESQHVPQLFCFAFLLDPNLGGSHTYQYEWRKNLITVQRHLGESQHISSAVIYGGETAQMRQNTAAIPWGQLTLAD